MVRALMHFSDLAKETEKLDESHYLLTVQYDKSDETEMLFRVLSFGPTIKVREPEDFKELIRKSSENSCNAAQNFKCVCFFTMIIACCCVKINIATSYFYKTEQMMEE